MFKSNIVRSACCAVVLTCGTCLGMEQVNEIDSATEESNYQRIHAACDEYRHPKSGFINWKKKGSELIDNNFIAMIGSSDLNISSAAYEELSLWSDATISTIVFHGTWRDLRLRSLASKFVSGMIEAYNEVQDSNQNIIDIKKKLLLIKTGCNIDPNDM